MEPWALLHPRWDCRLCVRPAHGAHLVLPQRYGRRSYPGCYELDGRRVRRTDVLGVHMVGCVSEKMVQGSEGQRGTHDAWRGAANP